MIYAMNHEEVLFYQAFSIQISCLIDQRIVTFGSKLNYFSIYCSKSTAHLRFQELQQKGIWKKILSKLIKLAHKQGKINLQKISIDSSSIAAKKVAMR